MCSTTLKASVLSKQHYSQDAIYIICIYDKHTSSSWFSRTHSIFSFLLIKIFFLLQRPGLYPQPLNNVLHFFKNIISLKQHYKHFNVVRPHHHHPRFTLHPHPSPGQSADLLLLWPSDIHQVQANSLAQHFYFMTGRQMKMLL